MMATAKKKFSVKIKIHSLVEYEDKYGTKKALYCELLTAKILIENALTMDINVIVH